MALSLPYSTFLRPHSSAGRLPCFPTIDSGGVLSAVHPIIKGAIDTTIGVIRCGTAVERDFLFQHVVSKQRDGAFFVIEARLGQRGPVRPVV